jgi:Hypoxia induced protein conserved region
MAGYAPTHYVSLMTTLNVLLVIFMVATVAVLLVGIVGFFLGGEFNRKYGNILMRWRVGLQAATLLLLGLLFMMSR